jgi:TonB family protein
MNTRKLLPLLLCTLPLFLYAQDLGRNTSFELLREAASLRQRDLRNLKAQSDGRDLRSQLLLGIAHQYGFATKQNSVIAARWFTKAAKAGDPVAEVILGRLYTEGIGVPQDESEAATWFRRAADTGNPEAQFELAESYANGRGVPRDWAQADALYRMAADSGYGPAKCSLRVNDPKYRPARRDAHRPKVINAPDPEYSEDARHAKFTGMVELWIGLGEDGTVQEACVRRPLGLGLDEKSLDAVRQWRFEPGTLDGRPIPFGLRITTSFNLH